MNFKIVNAKNKKMEFKKLIKYSISINYIKNRVSGKNQGNEIKDSGEAYDFSLFTDVQTSVNK